MIVKLIFSFLILFSPLAYSAEGGDEEMPDDVVFVDASPEMPDMSDVPAVGIALRHFEEEDKICYFKRLAKLGNERKTMLTLALCEASAEGDLPLVQSLLEAGADVNISGAGPAVRIDDVYFSRTDLNPRALHRCFGGDVYLCFTPLQQAAAHNRVDVFHFLCSKAKARYSKTYSGLPFATSSRYNIFEMAIIEDLPEILQLLFDYNFESPNRPILNGGEYPLHVAVRHHSLQALEVLMLNGANVLVVNKSGRKPVDLIEKTTAHSRLITDNSEPMRSMFENHFVSLENRCILRILEDTKGSPALLQRLRTAQANAPFGYLSQVQQQKLYKKHLKDTLHLPNSLCQKISQYYSSVLS